MQRSRFVAGGVAAGGAALVGLAAGRPGRSRAATGDDLEALQLLLLIEHTENAFYKAALDRGGLRGELRTYAGTVSGQEREHLDFARRALGAKASPEPRFEFSAAALDPGGFAETAAQLEDLAVAAYNGQATNVSRATFEAVAKIVSVERLAEGEFTCLVVTRLERLAGSASELAALARKLERHGVRLVVTEIDFDSAAGRSRIAARPLAHAHRVEEPNGSRPQPPRASARHPRRPSGAQAADRRHAHQRDDAPGDRGHAQRRGHPHSARGRQVAPVQPVRRARPAAVDWPLPSDSNLRAGSRAARPTDPERVTDRRDAGWPHSLGPARLGQSAA